MRRARFRSRIRSGTMRNSPSCSGPPEDRGVVADIGAAVGRAIDNETTENRTRKLLAGRALPGDAHTGTEGP